MCYSQTCTNMPTSTFSTKLHFFPIGLELFNKFYKKQNSIADDIRFLATSSLCMVWIENIKNIYFRYFTVINSFSANNFLFLKLMS